MVTLPNTILRCLYNRRHIYFPKSYMIVLAPSQHQGGERAAQAQAEAAAHPLVSCKAHVHVPPRKGGGLDAIGISKSWFAVLNNPADHGYTGTPQEVCEKLRSEWLSVSDSRTGAWVYCVSADGLHHVHMVLEDSVAMRFSKIKKSYAVGMHFEATKGNKDQAEAYITKQPPFDEKGEQILYTCRHGEIQAVQGRRTDLEKISDMLEAGLTPREIMAQDFSYRRYERMIKSAYFDKRKRETPVIREVKVHYLVGESGSGKSYTYASLCEEYGEDQVYFFSDYEGGGWDGYQGERFLFLDELKGQFPFSLLLQILDKFKTQLHARYSNVVALWSEVYITSVFPPDELYKRMVEETVRGRDKQQQLFRRITDITYCYIDEAGNHQRYTIPMSQYKDYETLKQEATTPDWVREIENEETSPEQFSLPF